MAKAKLYLWRLIGKDFVNYRKINSYGFSIERAGKVSRGDIVSVTNFTDEFFTDIPKKVDIEFFGKRGRESVHPKDAKPNLAVYIKRELRDMGVSLTKDDIEIIGQKPDWLGTGDYSELYREFDFPKQFEHEYLSSQKGR